MPALGSKIEIDKPKRSAMRRRQLPRSMNDWRCANAATPRRAAPWTRLSQRMRSPREDETHPRWAIIKQAA